MIVPRQPIQPQREDPAVAGIESYSVLGTRISALNLDRTLDLLTRYLKARRRGYVCVCSLQEIVESLRDADVRAAIHRAWVATPNGMPLVWWGRGRRTEASRICGADLLQAVLRDPRHRESRHYFYGGGDPAATRKMVNAVRRNYPEARVAGWWTPLASPFDPREIRAATEAIDGAGADIVWVGLSGRKQALWLAAMRPRLQASLLVGVGAEFATLAGDRRGASWLARLGRGVTLELPWVRGLPAPEATTDSEGNPLRGE